MAIARMWHAWVCGFEVACSSVAGTCIKVLASGEHPCSLQHLPLIAAVRADCNSVTCPSTTCAIQYCVNGMCLPTDALNVPGTKGASQSDWKHG